MSNPRHIAELTFYRDTCDRMALTYDRLLVWPKPWANGEFEQTIRTALHDCQDARQALLDREWTLDVGELHDQVNAVQDHALDWFDCWKQRATCRGGLRNDGCHYQP